MKVALYARVSTAEEKELQNPKTQFFALRQYCKANDLKIARAFLDRRSGKDSNRPGFLSMLEEAERKDRRFDGIVILRLDRFIRNAEEGMNQIKRMEAADCRLILVKDNILGNVDTRTPMGAFFVRMMLALGQLEREQTGVRVSEGIKRRIHEGKGWGRKKRTDINTGLAIELLKVRGSVNAVAKELGIPRTTLMDHFEREGVDYRTYLPCRNTTPPKEEGGSNILDRGSGMSVETSPAAGGE